MGEVRLENGKRNHRQPETAAHAAPAKKRRRSPWLSALQIAKHGPDRYAEARKRSSSEEFRFIVIPAKAGIKGCKSALVPLDPSPDLIRGSRRGDGRK